MRSRIPALCFGLLAATGCDQPLLQKIHSIQPPNVDALGPPEALRALVITPAAAGKLHLAFTDANQPNARTGYRVTRRQGAAAFAEVALVKVADLTDAAHPSYDDAVTPGQSYDYQVTVVNAYDDSPVVAGSAWGPVAPVLAWTGNPRVEASCQLHLDGTVTQDPHWPGATTDGGALALAASVTATDTGLVATVTTSTTGSGTATWTVQDSVDTTQLTRALTFSSQPTARMTPPVHARRRHARGRGPAAALAHLRHVQRAARRARPGRHLRPAAR